VTKAADHAGALLRKLDLANQQRHLDLMIHSPTCTRPGVTTESGHSVDVTRCTGCGCLVTVRHGVVDQTQTTRQTTTD